MINMPKPSLKEPFRTLEFDLIEFLLGGLKQYRPDLSYPQSHSDMQACVRAIIKAYDIERRPLARKSIEIYSEED
jgi:hypothetical protein